MLTIYVVQFNEVDLACGLSNKHPSKNKYRRGTPLINPIISSMTNFSFLIEQIMRTIYI